MFVIKIFVTLLLIQSLQLTFAQQDDDDLGSIESLPRFEARRQSTLNGNNKEDFEYDDDDGASRGPVNPLPARTGRNSANNEDDYDENQAPQREDSGSLSAAIVSNPGPASVKGQVLPSSTGRLSLPRFPGQAINSFVAPLPVVPVSVPARPTPVSIATPSAPITVVGKTNLGGDSSGTLSVPRLVRPNEPTKTIRVVKTRVIRPNPIADDQSTSLSSGIEGEIKSSQVTPTISRVVRPVLVTRQPQPAFVTPVFQPVAQPVRQPSRLEVIYADEKLSTQEEDQNEEDANAAGLSRPNFVKFNRPLAPVPIRAVPQPYLLPLNVKGSRPLQPTTNGVFFQPSIQTSARPTLVPSGKTNSFRSTFTVRPQPVSVAPTLVPVAPIQSNPTPILIDSGSQSAVSPVSKVQPPRLRVITTQRPTSPVQVFDEAGLGSGVSGVKGSGVASGSRSIVRPVLVRTPAPSPRPLVQVQEEPLPTFQQIDLVRTQPVARPFTTFQEQTKLLPSVQPAPRPTSQPVVQIRDSALSAELPLPSPPRPIQIVRVTPAPTVRPITQVTQVRESALPSVQPVRVSQPRLIPVSPVPQPQVIQISEPARPLTQIRESTLPFFQPLDPALRPAIPAVKVTNQGQESIAPREIILRQPIRPVQVIQPQPQRQQLVHVNQVQQPSITETVQLKESAVPITSSQINLGTQRLSRPQPVQTIVTVPQEPAPTPQPFEILRLREPNFPQFPLAPQPIVSVRPRLIPAALPSQTVQANLPVARPSLLQISQEKETVSLPQPFAPVTNVRFVRPIAQTRPLVRLAPVAPVQTVAPVAPISVQGSLSQPGEQQLVQIREKVPSVPEQFSQIEQIRLARA